MNSSLNRREAAAFNALKRNRVPHSPHGYMKEGPSRKAFVLCNTIFLSLLMFITIYPILHILMASFSNSNKLMAHRGILLWPKGFTLASYRAVFKNPFILAGYRNTFVIVILGVLLNMAMSILGGYGLSRRGLKFGRALNQLVIFTMFFSGGLIPFYLVIRQLGIYDTLWALIFPVAINTYNMIIIRTTFAAIPPSLEESAKLDGANDFTILLRIMLPLTTPTLAVLILYYAQGHWNAWFNASIFLRNRKLYPLQLILREILISNDTTMMTQNVDMSQVESIGHTIKYALIVVSMAPILAFYPFIQRFFEKGVMIGAVKG